MAEPRPEANQPAAVGAGQGSPVDATAARQGMVVVVGDESAADAVAAFRQANVPVSDDKASLPSAGLVVIAQDATHGIRPIHRELVKELAAAGKRDVLWILTKTPLVDDKELLELEVLEVREQFTTHKLPGETIQFGADSDAAPVDATTLKGWTAITRHVSERSKP
jgi:hypothetical protein